jgi:NAD(P)-dependent dehydrogenase (short-subunit alcohol dehydrogenase family)
MNIAGRDVRPPRKVAVVTGASQGLGAGMVSAFRKAGYAVVGTSRSMPLSDQPDFLTVQGDIADADTARRVVASAVDRFGRIDSLKDTCARPGVLCRSGSSSPARPARRNQ